MAEQGTHLVLVGAMGAGKSTVGSALSDALGRPFVDADEVLSAETGQSVADMFAHLGEPAFRALEVAAVAELLAAEEPAVVATGGGVVLDADTRAALRRQDTIWLRAEPATLVRRVGSGAGRPLLDHDPAGTLPRLAAERAPLYGEVATLVVDVDGLSVAEVVRRILEAPVDRPGGAS